MQTALISVKLQLESEQQTLAAVQGELATAQQQQAALQHTLQQERNQVEEQTRKVHSCLPHCTELHLLSIHHSLTHLPLSV